MVTYNYECDTCPRQAERTVPMAERNEPWPCTCGGTMKRSYCAVPHKWDGCEWPGGWRPKGTPSGQFDKEAMNKARDDAGYGDPYQ